MQFDFDGTTPLYLQVAEQIEEAVLVNSYGAGEQVPSTTEISREFHINPATVLKGMNILVADKVIEKRRGLGMFVLDGARERIVLKRRGSFYETTIRPLIIAAKSIDLTQGDVTELIERGYRDDGTNNN
ncbi:GntR family transcriptional regulator [Furfurilactobacillus sp. WILCCON 0119]|uniref:GntR family transcriptional regulator n=1 Tax=Furfurilactobacillus entadae TaxID=2922307 RepID=UPI0035EB633E